MDNNLAVQDASQGMPTAQVPVNARVTAAAKQVKQLWQQEHLRP